MKGSAATAAAVAEARRRVHFDGWTVDLTTGELWKDGAHLRLPEQPRQILAELLARPGELVTREELIARLWPRVVVDYDTGLNTAVRRLRLALGDAADEPRYIETLPRKGYRFIGRLETGEGPPSAAVQAAAAHPSRRALALAAGVLAVVAFIGVALWSRTPPAVSDTSGPAMARELLLAAQARQPEISPNEGSEPRRRLMELLDRALVLDPSLALAHVVRARAQLDAFASNVDVGEATLAMIQTDLAAARRLSGDPQLGLDVEAQYAFLVDRNPERALRLVEAAPGDAEVQRAHAVILHGTGRLQESDAILDRFLALDPGNQRLARLRISNLIVEGRGAEALRAIEALSAAGGTPQRMPDAIVFGITGRTDFARPPVERVEQMLRAPDPEGETLARVLPELTLLRAEQRFDDEHRLLAASTATSVRVPTLSGALPGLGRLPVALLRGWNDLLRGDAARAATRAADVQAFVRQQRVTQYNDWLLVLFEAQARLFAGDTAAAIAGAQRAEQTGRALTHVHVALLRDYLVAQTLAWAGERDAAVVRLRGISGDVPVAMPPALIAREPLFLVPLRGHAGFEALREDLERRLQAASAIE
jgi:DNA-binding winged helix-turn-helix (wHTH) protein/tetratricopeptide (TPR) repeat protein